MCIQRTSVQGFVLGDNKSMIIDAVITWAQINIKVRFCLSLENK